MQLQGFLDSKENIHTCIQNVTDVYYLNLLEQ